jgi:hypothetical protein
MATAIVAAVQFSLITCCGEYRNICANLGMCLTLCTTVRCRLPLPFFNWWHRKNYRLLFWEIQHKCLRPLGTCRTVLWELDLFVAVGWNDGEAPVDMGLTERLTVQATEGVPVSWMHEQIHLLKFCVLLWIRGNGGSPQTHQSQV